MALGLVGGSVLFSLVDDGPRPVLIVATFCDIMARSTGNFEPAHFAELVLFHGCTGFVVQGFRERVETGWRFGRQEAISFFVAIPLTITGGSVHLTATPKPVYPYLGDLGRIGNA